VALAREAGAGGKYFDAMYELSQTLDQEFGKKIVINVSAAIAAALSEAGLPAAIMRGITLIARCAGLVGHLMEEMETPAAPFIWHLVEERVPYAGTMPQS